MRIFTAALLLLVFVSARAQTKQPLTQSVYDGWKSVASPVISNNGQYAAYMINPQEGDGNLVIEQTHGTQKKEIARGYSAVFTQDSRYVVFKIKPVFSELRTARIKKKKPDEMPKDSIGFLLLGTDSLVKLPLGKSFKTPENNGRWLAWAAERPVTDSAKKKALPDSVKLKIDGLVKMADSILRLSLDSIHGNISKQALRNAAEKAAKSIYKNADDESDAMMEDAEGDDAATEKAGEGTNLILMDLLTGARKKFTRVSEYMFDKNGSKLLLEMSKNLKDSNSRQMVLLYEPLSGRTDTVLKKFNDAKSFVFDESGSQLAFVAERDSSTKSLQKFYRLWYFKTGDDTAHVYADRNAPGIAKGLSVSENAVLKFSKDGSKLFFGTAPIIAAKDTNLVDFELARVDVWHYNDDYLQPQQLKQLPAELKRSYTAVLFPADKKVIQLGADSSENISLINEGNSDFLLAQSTKGNRLASQWEGRSLTTAYLIDSRDGSYKLISSKGLGAFSSSPGGKYIYWYDPILKSYFTYNIALGIKTNVSSKIKTPLYDTENDVPDYPASAGTTGWTEGDRDFLINDEYDIWKTDPEGVNTPVNITGGYGTANKINFDFVKTDTLKRFFTATDTLLLRSLDKKTKAAGWWRATLDKPAAPTMMYNDDCSLPVIVKAKNASSFLFTRGDIKSLELYTSDDLKNVRKLTDVSAQQEKYNWLTAELFRWKMFDGKMSEGVLYKPENFDSTKKYPIIFYFYERNSNTLNNYKAPAPSASTINIPYFVSNGYIVADPNIYYKTGEPGQSAYNSVVSAAKYFAKMPWIDSNRMAIQGQSWGGYQVAYLITRTNIFRAAGAGAPVSNMTSAYGGIRWGPGINRQFQYEKQQSRIGATLWQRPDLYIKNSPLFAADKIKTPLLIMHNDADGSVPWYQGIEMFTAMKRLGKKVWMLEYNGEDHNLTERKNRKDLSVRLSQFFDYYLKDARPADWIRYGVPATKKGIDWGLTVPAEEPVEKL